MRQGERISRTLQEEDKIIYLAFSSHNGKQALEILRQRFYDHSPYSKGDPYHTNYLVGQQDVVGFILEAMREGEKNVDI